MDRHSLITVVGGSGFVGRYVVEELARTGARIRVVVRNPNAAMFLKPLGDLGQIQLIGGDIRSERSMAAACADATGVVNLVGILRESGASFDAVHVTGAALLARAAAAAGAQSFVHVSAIGADPRAASGYARSKGNGEAAVRAAFPAATILRPSVIFGPEDGFINRFAGLAARLPFAMPVIAGNRRFQPVYVLDVAKAIVAALDDPRRFGGEVIELGGPKIYTMRELIGWIMEQVYADKPVVEIPDAVAGRLASAIGWLPGAPLTKDQWLMLQHDTVVSGENGLARFGVVPTPLEAIAPTYLVRYRRHGRFTTGGATYKAQREG